MERVQFRARRIGLLLAWCALGVSTAQAAVIALKRDAGLNAAGAIDPRFVSAVVVQTTVSDTGLYDAGESRWGNGGAMATPGGQFSLYKFDLAAVPGLANATINRAELRLWHTVGNGAYGRGGVGMILTHDWLEGPGTIPYYSYPGAVGGASYAHPAGRNTYAWQNATGGGTDPKQSWGPNSDSFFARETDMGPVQEPHAEPAGQGFHVIDVTAHVQAWVSGTLPNYGWAQTGAYDFHMSEASSNLQPVLFIDYVEGVDGSPPAAVADLTIGSATSSSLTLTWTAPGDDGSTGTAASYDIRYSASPITEANWGSATQITGEPAPQAAGTSQSMVISGLVDNTTYHFAMKTFDEIPNGSGLSNVAMGQTPADTAPPAAVADLATGNATFSSLTLTWTAPGDDAATGTAAGYDIRYSTSPITAANWASATQVTGEPTPAVAGTSQNMVISGLLGDTTYYFAMKASDEVSNVSGLSNVATGQTPPDTAPPAAVADLVVSRPKATTLTLTWTAPGDDANVGTAASYDIRYATAPITEANWAAARQVGGEPVPQVAGTSQSMVVTGLAANTTYYFAVKTLDEVPNGSALSNVASGQTLTSDPLNRALLRQEDFEYLGAFALPQYACGHATAYAHTGLALRRVNGQLRLLTGSHRYSGDAIYEVSFPGWSTEIGAWPQAPIVREWGTAIYGDPNKKTIKNGTEQGWTHGLNYDEATGRLYFSFGSWYNIPPTNEVSLGCATLDESGPVAYGSWKAPEALAHCQKIRGGSLIIPNWFADRYLEGRTLGVGFGGHYSGFAGCSKGPFLAAAYPPDPATTELDVVPMIDHPDEHWGTRDADYWTETSWLRPPVNGVGYWGLWDETFGAVTWIDLPDRHGLLVISSMGHGHVWYEDSDRHCDRLEIHWWIYDPTDLAAVAQGSKQPWDLQPDTWIVQYSPRPDRPETPGCAFDPQTRTLFVLAPTSYQAGLAYYPIVHGYRIKQARLVGDINNDGYVNVGDLQLLVAAWGSQATPPGSNWNADADINSDDFVNVGDLQLLVAHWGEQRQ